MVWKCAAFVYWSKSNFSIKYENFEFFFFLVLFGLFFNAICDIGMKRNIIFLLFTTNMLYVNEAIYFAVLFT